MRAENGKWNLFGACVVIGLGLAVLILTWSDGQHKPATGKTSTQPTREPADSDPHVYRLRSKDGGDLPVTTTREADERLTQLSVANDLKGINEMRRRGLVVLIASGTKVRRLQGGPWSAVELRVLEGPHEGKTVWVSGTDWLSRD